MRRFTPFSRLLDRLASLSARRARSRAEFLSKNEPERALKLFAAAAARGDREAAFLVGEHYLEGKGTLRHQASAARWYHRAAEAGHIGAQCRLAQLHLFGLQQGALGHDGGLFERHDMENVHADYHGALVWAQIAAEAGAADAQAMLAYILTSGPEDLRDPDAAFAWYRKSAEQNCPQGSLGYALALIMRAGTTGMTSTAYDELVRAANAGLPTAHYLLGADSEYASGTTRDEAKARYHYTIAAESGVRNAQVRLGLLLLEGRGGPGDPLGGESWLRRAAHGGDIEAAALLGDVYSRGGTLPPNYAEAAHWFRIAADQGHKSAARRLGMLYLTGGGVMRDADEAAIWFRRAAEAGDPDAQADLATLLQAGNTPSLVDQPPPVHEWFKHAAEQGDLVGAFNYAVCLAEGVGVPRNDEGAIFWLRRAADGVVNAQYWYGRMLAEGRGVAKNIAEATVWLLRAAEAGLAEAQLAIAQLHFDGQGVARDHRIAESWLLRAAELGHPDAMFALGILYGGGHGGEPDYDLARRCFVQAAERGHANAALMLARYSTSGLGGPMDVENGQHWYTYANSLGALGADDELEALRVQTRETDGITPVVIQARQIGMPWNGGTKIHGR